MNEWSYISVFSEGTATVNYECVELYVHSAICLRDLYRRLQTLHTDVSDKPATYTVLLLIIAALRSLDLYCPDVNYVSWRITVPATSHKIIHNHLSVFLSSSGNAFKNSSQYD